MKVLINTIQVNARVRQDMGNLASLKTSMQEHGQLNPITLARNNALVAGHRRLLAAQELGWEYIDAIIIDRDSEVECLQLELEENVHRKDFSPEELLDGYRRLERLKRPGIGTRFTRSVKRLLAFLFGWMKPKSHTRTAPAADVPTRQPDDEDRPKPAGDEPVGDEQPGQYGV